MQPGVVHAFELRDTGGHGEAGDRAGGCRLHPGEEAVGGIGDAQADPEALAGGLDLGIQPVEWLCQLHPAPG